MRTLFLIFMYVFGFVPEAYGQIGMQPFFCMANYYSIDVKPYANQMVVTLNVAISKTVDSYLGDFYAHIPGQVLWDAQGHVHQIVATSNTYTRGHWNPKTGRVIYRYRPGTAKLTINFTPFTEPDGRFGFSAVGYIKERKKPLIRLPLGYCRPPAG